MQRILGCVRNAVDTYNMIEYGDKIAVGVSGGKDSVLLLKALCGLKTFYPKDFELVAITLDMRFDNQDGDFSPIQKLCDELTVLCHYGYAQAKVKFVSGYEVKNVKNVKMIAEDMALITSEESVNPVEKE